MHNYLYIQGSQSTLFKAEKKSEEVFNQGPSKHTWKSLERTSELKRDCSFFSVECLEKEPENLKWWRATIKCQQLEKTNPDSKLYFEGVSVFAAVEHLDSSAISDLHASYVSYHEDVLIM